MTALPTFDIEAAKKSAYDFDQIGHNFLPGHLGIHIIAVSKGEVRAELEVVPHLLAPNGFLHAGKIGRAHV